MKDHIVKILRATADKVAALDIPPSIPEKSVLQPEMLRLSFELRKVFGDFEFDWTKVDPQ
jgi:hypothetical protein